MVNSKNRQWTLLDEEYDVLVKIVRKTRMDCWFMLKFSETNGHYIEDIENNKRMSLRQGVKQLADGIIDQNLDELTTDEKLTFIKLLADLI